MKVASEFLHIIKRLRYRLFSCIVHAGFENDPETAIEICNLIEILDLSPVVWNNEAYTKMHDALPICLFDLPNLLELFNANYYQAVGFHFFAEPCNVCIYWSCGVFQFNGGELFAKSYYNVYREVVFPWIFASLDV